MTLPLHHQRRRWSSKTSDELAPGSTSPAVSDTPLLGLLERHNPQSSESPLLGLWKRALNLYNSTLTRDDKKLLNPRTWNIKSSTELLQLVTAAKDKAERDRRPWHDSIQRIFRQVNRYAVVGDLISQHHAEYTSLVWGSFRFLLLCAVEGYNTSEKLAAALDQILQIIFRVEEYSKIFTMPPTSTTQRVYNSLWDNCIRILAEVLNFLIRAAKFFDKPTFRRYFSASVSSFDNKFQGILDRIAQYERNLAKDRAVLGSEADKLETQYANGVWLKHADFEVNLRKLQQGYILGTCIWFMQSDVYAHWQDTSAGARKANMLWIQGKPGSGKSTLVSQIVKELSSLENCILLSVFCKAGEENKSDLGSVLRNLIFQLMVKSPKHDEYHFQVQTARLKEKTVYVQSIETVWKLFQEMLTDPVPVYCIVDGLDECTETLQERQEFLERLSKAFAEGHSENRLMIISRLDKSEVENGSGSWQFLQIRPVDVGKDIELLVTTKMDKCKTLSVHPEIEQLKKALVEGADGMILWADLMVTELEAGHWDVQSVLKRPPLGLSDIYGSVLRRLSLDKRAMIKAQRVLDLVLTVGRPLRNDELALALAVMGGLKSQADYDSRGDPVSEGQAILRETSPLLTVMSDDTIQIVHASLRDFLFTDEAASLLRVQFSIRSCNTEISKVLINYLSFDCFGDEAVDSSVKSERALLEYASNWLTYHVSFATGSNEVASSLVTLFKKNQGWKWLQRLGQTYGLSYGHLQLMQSKIRDWTESLNIEQDDKDILCNFLLFLAKSRYEDSKRIEGDTPSQLTLASMIYLASTYYWQGQWKEAEALDSQVLSIKTKILGERHVETLKSMINLASSYRNQGRWKAAEELQLRALGLMGSIYRDHDPEVLRSKANLAAIWRNQKRLVAAEELQLQVLKARSAFLPDESHPDILTSKANLALTYYDARKLSDAGILQEDVLKTTIKSLGSNHPYTLSSMANLAATYRNQGRWRDAAELGRKTVEVRKSVLGEDHPYTLNSTVGLAATYLNQGNFIEAEGFLTRVMELRCARLGEDHPETLTGMGSLALTYCLQERWAEAEVLQVRTLDLVRSRFDDGHPFRLICMTNLVLTYRNQGKWDVAEPLLKEIKITILNTDHGIFLGHLADFATNIPEKTPEPPGKGNIARLLEAIEQGKQFAKEQKWAEERNLQFQTMQLRRKVIGEDNPDTLTGMANLSLAGQDQAR